MKWSLKLGKLLGIGAYLHFAFLLLFASLGFLHDPLLVFIAIFAFHGAQAKAGLVEMQSALTGLRIRDSLMSRCQTLSSQGTRDKAGAGLLAGSQHDSPVMNDGQPVGILRRNDLVKALPEGRSDASVADAMSRGCEMVDENSSLQVAVQTMRTHASGTVPVMVDGRLVVLFPSKTFQE